VPKPRLAILIGSTRPGRAGLPVAQWFAQRAREHAGFEVEIVDLAQSCE
jgi:NAD(P)H-dependent FMN reductase